MKQQSKGVAKHLIRPSSTDKSKFFLATLIISAFLLTFFGSSYSANAEVLSVIEGPIQGVTAPVPGATPVLSFDENAQYSGTVSWSSINGPLIGNFQPNTIYKAVITLTAKAGYTFTGVAEDDLEVLGTNNYSNDANSGVITSIYFPTERDARLNLDISFGDSGVISSADIFGLSPLDETNTEVDPVKIDRIAIDSQARIVVLASFIGADESDNHILFRLNEDGTYDYDFGSSDTTLKKNLVDTPKPYVLVTRTCISFSERLDLEIDSMDRVLVLLSGYAETGCSGQYNNFVARYTEVGSIDTDFGDDGDGVIGVLTPRNFADLPEGEELFLFADLTVDDQNRLLVSRFSLFRLHVMIIQRFLNSGLIDINFGLAGSYLVQLNEVAEICSFPYRNSSLITDDDGGYVIAFSGARDDFASDDCDLPPEINPIIGEFVSFTQLIRINQDGEVDSSFTFDFGSEIFGTDFLIPNFFLTDIANSGSNGFLISGTQLVNNTEFFGITFRITIEGDLDLDFLGPPEINLDLNPIYSNMCINSALLKNQKQWLSTDGIILGNLCGDGGKLKTYSSSGEYKGNYYFLDSGGPMASQITNQLIESEEGKVVALNGAPPTNGLFGYLLSIYGSADADWSQTTIRRYLSTTLRTPLPPDPEPEPGPSFIPAPQPVPYLRTLTVPMMSKNGEELVCTAGTYSSGYTIGGAVQADLDTTFIPSLYTFNLIISGVVQPSLLKTTPNSSTTWNLSVASSGAIVTCSVTVEINGLTNIDKTSDGKSKATEAFSILNASIAAADDSYNLTIMANTKSYQKLLEVNRAVWRATAAKVRSDYYLELDSIKASGNSKTVRTLSSAALQRYIAAQKQSAVDYKASQPLAVAQREAANKAALEVKQAQILLANKNFGSMIESMGYGVLVP